MALDVAGQTPARMSIANVSTGDSISDSVLLPGTPVFHHGAPHAGGVFFPPINVLAGSRGGYQSTSQDVGEAGPWLPSNVLYPVPGAPNDKVDHEPGLAFWSTYGTVTDGIAPPKARFRAVVACNEVSHSTTERLSASVPAGG